MHVLRYIFENNLVGLLIISYCTHIHAPTEICTHYVYVYTVYKDYITSFCHILFNLVYIHAMLIFNKGFKIVLKHN